MSGVSYTVFEPGRTS